MGAFRAIDDWLIDSVYQPVAGLARDLFDWRASYVTFVSAAITGVILVARLTTTPNWDGMDTLCAFTAPAWVCMYWGWRGRPKGTHGVLPMERSHFLVMRSIFLVFAILASPVDAHQAIVSTEMLKRIFYGAFCLEHVAFVSTLYFDACADRPRRPKDVFAWLRIGSPLPQGAT